ncbi:hypothetical protein PFISCL1PPCAC_12913, partial [Pristionchus fissidentatus]
MSNVLKLQRITELISENSLLVSLQIRFESGEFVRIDQIVQVESDGRNGVVVGAEQPHRSTVNSSWLLSKHELLLPNDRLKLSQVVSEHLIVLAVGEFADGCNDAFVHLTGSEERTDARGYGQAAGGNHRRPDHRDRLAEHGSTRIRNETVSVVVQHAVDSVADCRGLLVGV